MIPAPFDYVRPATIAEAVQAYTAAGEDGKILAGGQSLLPILRLRLAYPELVIDLGGITELTGVTDEGDAILIGAMTTHSDVLGNPLVTCTHRCWCRPPRRWPTGRCATAAPSADRWRTRTRPVTYPRWR